MKQIAATNLPALAHYNDIAKYTPAYGDYVVWAGWITTWYGIVVNHDVESGEVSVIFSGLPYILFTLNEDEQEQETRKIKLSRIKSSRHGEWAVQQHDVTRNVNVWYI